MHCYICDKTLASDEIKIDPRYGTFDPCGECLTIIDEVFETATEEEIDQQLSFELFRREENEYDQALSEEKA